MSSIQPRGPVTHDLKCWPEPFQDLQDGLKTFEWRKADRDYQAGDTLHLREWNRMIGDYTGREITVTVTYILHGPDYGIPEGYCIMGVVPVEQAGVPSASISRDVAQRALDLFRVSAAEAEVLRERAYDKRLYRTEGLWGSAASVANADADAIEQAIAKSTPDPQKGETPDA